MLEVKKETQIVEVDLKHRNPGHFGNKAHASFSVNLPTVMCMVGLSIFYCLIGIYMYNIITKGLGHIKTALPNNKLFKRKSQDGNKIV